MYPALLCLPLLAAGFLVLLAGQQPTSQPKTQTTAAGVFIGRSGKPMAKARLTLGEIAGDQEVLYAKVRLSAKSPTVVSDSGGRFQFTGFAPGTYTIVYQPAGAAGLLPTEINIRPLLASTRSLMPMMRGVEIGRTGEPFAERVWGRTFTLLTGHTFYSEGANMKIWNATARHGAQGPYLEMRRGIPWQQRLEDKSQIKLEAWSF